MDFYGKNLTLWQQRFQKTLDYIPAEKIGIALPAWYEWPAAELQTRFDMISAHPDIEDVEVWDMTPGQPTPASLYASIGDWLRDGRGH